MVSTRRVAIRDLGFATGAVVVGEAIASLLYQNDAQVAIELMLREVTVAEMAKVTSKGRISLGTKGVRV